MLAARSSSQRRDTGSSASYEVVLAEAKLAPTRMRSQTIERPRVTRALDADTAGGALAEVRTTELGFTAQETRELVVGWGGVPLEPDEVEMLHRRTDGWPAALVLAALWLRRVDDVPRGVREFGGDHRVVVDYLSNEVLALLPPDRRSDRLKRKVTP
jgi:ATP/maltotriose-dependent transcriptional regulator MalT